MLPVICGGYLLFVCIGLGLPRLRIGECPSAFFMFIDIFFDDVPDAPEASSGTTAAAPSASASSVSFTEATEAEENDCCGGKIEKPDTTRKA